MAPETRFAPARLLQALKTDDPAALAQGARQAYRLTFGLTALLGFLLGLLGMGLRPLALGQGAAVPLLVTGALLAALVLWHTGWQLRRELARAGGSRQRRTLVLSAAFGLSAAPAVPWLLACAVLPRPGLALGLAGLSALAYVLGRRQLRQWAQQA